MIKQLISTVALAASLFAQTPTVGITRADGSEGGGIYAAADNIGDFPRDFVVIYGFSGIGVMPNPVMLQADIFWYLPPCSLWVTKCVRRERCADEARFKVVRIFPGTLPPGLTLYAQGIVLNPKTGRGYSNRVDSWVVQ